MVRPQTAQGLLGSVDLMPRKLSCAAFTQASTGVPGRATCAAAALANICAAKACADNQAASTPLLLLLLPPPPRKSPHTPMPDAGSHQH